MFKKLFILSVLVYFVLGMGVLLAGPPKPAPQPPPKEVKSTGLPPPVIKPDLIVSEIKFQNIINKGNCEIFDVIIDVKNIDHAPSGPFKVLLEKKVEPYPDFKIACSACEIPVSGLAGGQTVSLPPLKFDTCGVVKKYIFRATADSKNSVAESNENNNSKVEAYPNTIQK